MVDVMYGATFKIILHNFIEFLTDMLTHFGQTNLGTCP